MEVEMGLACRTHWTFQKYTWHYYYVWKKNAFRNGKIGKFSLNVISRHIQQSWKRKKKHVITTRH